MRLFAIGDLHLPGGNDKSMDIFGPHWEGHFLRIAADWEARVRPEDVVLIPGDISWAMRLRDAAGDLAAISRLPGHKVLIKGNHDYWWSSMTKVTSLLPPDMTALQHNAVDVGPVVVCGTRGWMFPTKETPLSAEDRKIYDRELIRLGLAIDDAKRIAPDKPIVVMMHYPPLYCMERETAFTHLLEENGVYGVVYGHLHGAGIRIGYQGEQQGVHYYLTSCDALDFSLAEIPVPEKLITL